MFSRGIKTYKNMVGTRDHLWAVSYYPLVICCAIENGPVEIVSFPMNSMVDFSSSFFVKLPEGIDYIDYRLFFYRL